MRKVVLALVPWLLVTATVAAARPLAVVVDFDNSRGLKTGDPVISSGKTIGEVVRVGFGARDTVEVELRIDDGSRDLVRKSSTFAILEKVGGGGASVEHFVIDPASPPASSGERFTGARSLAEVWLRRGRITAEELSRSMARGMDEFRRNLEELQRSKEWAKFKDQIAGLSARLTATGLELSRLLNEQLPKLQKELDDLYQQYLDELERQKQERDKREKKAP